MLTNVNVIDISQMIDLIEEFYQSTTEKVLRVGEMFGCELFRYVIDKALLHNTFPQILILDGCQDYLGLTKNDIYNHRWYGECLTDIPLNSLKKKNCMEALWYMNDIAEYIKSINTSLLDKYYSVIIRNAHLIRPDLLDLINEACVGKVVNIFDPFDIGGERYNEYPTITDSFSGISVIGAVARNIYNVETRSIDKKIKSNVDTIKISLRSIGKIDERQYISNDPDIISMVSNKQYETNKRKGQKFLVDSDMTYRVGTDMIVSRGSMLVITSTTNTSQLQNVRLYSSKKVGSCIMSYDSTDPLIMKVKPANIISIQDQKLHRYKNTVLVLSSPLTARENYSVLKNSINLSVTFKK